MTTTPESVRTWGASLAEESHDGLGERLIQIADAWEQSVLAERHECAKILEDAARMIPFGENHQTTAYESRVLTAFARQIRERKP